MERFCSRYEEVKNLSFSEMAAALVDYAPDFFKQGLIEASENRPTGWVLTSRSVNEFISRCPPEASVP